MQPKKQLKYTLIEDRKDNRWCKVREAVDELRKVLLFQENSKQVWHTQILPSRDGYRLRM